MEGWRAYFRALAIYTMVHREQRPILAQLTVDGSAAHYTPFPVGYVCQPHVTVGGKPPDGGEPVPLESRLVHLDEWRRAG